MLDSYDESDQIFAIDASRTMDRHRPTGRGLCRLRSSAPLTPVADPKRLTTVAVVAATAEERARQSPASTDVVRYLDAIERLGYQPADWEHTQHLTTAV